uniref:Anaerobic ribonucleoside-triphosphate reductase activating protein n=1 Tax=Candidatus Kentrum sp. DK TaxID=2126562 RepID=A0A450T1Z0_9GAMM|nr:MAG: anaerobic ribonucleoside-triphosphate reductase activating protein [Candidatus Kentron sp. DK]
MSRLLNIQSLWRGRCPLLGPALMVWVQGCPFRCPGCFNSDALDGERQCLMMFSTRLAEVFSEEPAALVLSGGEPFAQASALVELIQLIRHEMPEVPILAYTGYRLEHLLTGEIEGAAALLNSLDVLVDGPFLRQRLSNHPLLGSDNQRVFLLGPRVSAARLKALDKPQIQLDLDGNGRLRMVGTGGNGRDMHEITRLIADRGLILE